MAYGAAEQFSFLFDQQAGELSESTLELLRHGSVAKYRTKTIKSGNVLECEIYPIWKCHRETRAARENTTRKEQQELNTRNARKLFARRLNANFTDADLCVTLTYWGELPDEKKAQKDIRNYLRRVRAWRKRNGLPELKYAYVVEWADGDGRRKRVHHHVVMSGMDRNEAEKIWRLGRAQAAWLRPEDGTLEGLAQYITKQPTKHKRWQTSRNLTEPTVTVSEHRMSKRKAEKLAQHVVDTAPELFEGQYDGYTFDRCNIYRSDIVAGVYIYAQLHMTRPRIRAGTRER